MLYVLKALVGKLADDGPASSFKFCLCYLVDLCKDEKKGLFHLEEAAILGHPEARFHLGGHEEKSRRVERGRIHRAVKHWIIAATLGLDRAIQVLKECYKEGYVSKEDFAAALRAHHVAANALKSSQREEAEKAKATGEIGCPCCVYRKLFPCSKKST